MESIRSQQPPGCPDVARSGRSLRPRRLRLHVLHARKNIETALITERRAQGRYDQRRTRWPAILFVGCALMVVGTVLLFN